MLESLGCRVNIVENGREALDNIRGLQREGGPNILAKVINLYFENAPKLLQSLREAVARANGAEEIRQSAHALRSSSASLGVTEMASLCKKLENMGREKRIEGAAEVFAQVDELYPRLCKALSAQCDDRAA